MGSYGANELILLLTASVPHFLDPQPVKVDTSLTFEMDFHLPYCLMDVWGNTAPSEQLLYMHDVGPLE